MNVSVRNPLSSRVATIHYEIESGDSLLTQKQLLDLAYKPEATRIIQFRQVEDRWCVASRYHQDMPG